MEGSNPLLESRFAHESPILQLAYSADGKTLASSAQDNLVKLWDAESIVERKVLEAQPDWPAALALSADGARLVVGLPNGAVAEYDSLTGKNLRDPDPD